MFIESLFSKPLNSNINNIDNSIDISSISRPLGDWEKSLNNKLNILGKYVIIGNLSGIVRLIYGIAKTILFFANPARRLEGTQQIKMALSEFFFIKQMYLARFHDPFNKILIEKAVHLVNQGKLSEAVQMANRAPDRNFSMTIKINNNYYSNKKSEIFELVKSKLAKDKADLFEKECELFLKKQASPVLVIGNHVQKTIDQAPTNSQSDEMLKKPAPAPFSEGRGKVVSLKDQKDIEVTIRKVNNQYGLITFEAYAQIDGKKEKLGYCQIDYLRKLESGKYGSENNCDAWLYTEYGKKRIENIEKIFVKYVESNSRKNYKGIGTILMQAAMEYGYSKNCEGCIELEAVRDSHPFYYKLGMRTKEKEKDTRILKRIQKYQGKEIPYKDFGVEIMHMTKKGRDLWRQRIIANPIFKETQHYLSSCDTLIPIKPKLSFSVLFDEIKRLKISIRF